MMVHPTEQHVSYHYTVTGITRSIMVYKLTLFLKPAIEIIILGDIK